jgi:hypothetical protein
VRLLCVWLDGQPYSCQLLGGAAQVNHMHMHVLSACALSVRCISHLLHLHLLHHLLQGRVVVQFEDGLQFSAEEGALRQMLEEPLFPTEVLQLDEEQPSRPGGRRMAAKPRAAGSPSSVRGAWVADASQRGPLQRVMGSFDQAWRGADAFAAHVRLLGKVKRKLHPDPDH